MAAAALAVVLLASLPYVVVALTAPSDLRFGGALVNPIDGQSYFAKMRQGFDGSWLFRLPYTASDEPDAFLFTFHLALGHLARITGTSPATIYHAARIFGGWAMLIAAYALIARVFDDVADRRRAWLFVALSSGLGWLGIGSSDVAIPESNTFFSILTNAHFAASTALMIAIFLAAIEGALLRAGLASIGLVILQPFAPIAVFAALSAGWLIGVWITGRRVFTRRQIVAAVASGLSLAPLMLYFYFATQQDPLLRQWSAQNLTPSPPPVEYLAGYGLMWLLAIPGARVALKRGRGVDLLLVAWAVTSALLLYAPFPLQRRFSLGLHIPIVLLGVMGMMQVAVPSLRGRAARWLPRVVLLASLPTTLILLLATSSAALRPPDGRLFFSSNESAGFDWLRESVSRDAVVLAAPETGLFLPGWAGVRVLYGHPFETVHAETMKAAVQSFYAGTTDRAALVREHGVDYVFYGPREAEIGRASPDWQSVFSVGDVTIYRMP
jgi:hypothetical protein